jgi:hypothetical protein
MGNCSIVIDDVMAAIYKYIYGSLERKIPLQTAPRTAAAASTSNPKL